MVKLAIIALDKIEHRILADVWKFFPFDGDIRYFYAYSGTKRSPEIVTHPNLHAKRFPGKPADVFATIQAFLKDNQTTESCFASLASFEIWRKAAGLESITLFSSPDLDLADIGGIGQITQKELSALSRLTGRGFAILKSEEKDILLPGETLVCEDFAAFQRAFNGEVLLTRNRDLISVLRGSRDFTITHIMGDSLSTNLDLGNGQTGFIDVLNKILRVSLAARTRENATTTGAGVPTPLSAYNPVYSLFAEYYDNYMSHVSYEDWVQVMLGWYKRFSSRPAKKVLELACGTANASEILVFKGLKVDACDNSPYMLHVADGKIFKPNLFLCSLTDPIPKKGYDFIFCLFDSVNYLTRKADIKTLLNNVSDALRPGGIFIFDISTLLNSLENFSDRYSITRVRDGYLIQISTFEILSYRQLTQFILFRKNRLGWTKSEERHVQRVYRTPELMEIIAGSALELKAVFSPQMRTNLLRKQGVEIDNRYFRLFFLAQKSEA